MNHLKHNVFKVYDKIFDWYNKHRCNDLSLEKNYINFIQSQIPTGAAILDVGCGNGKPIAKFFIENGYKVTGIDASIKMIESCKVQFPKERWILADMRELKLDLKFDVVIALHSFFHLPPEDQRKTLKLFITFLKQDGILAFTSNADEGEVWGENGGHNLYHASLSSTEYKKILEENNCRVLIHTIEDPVCGGATVWIAKKK